MSTEFKPIGMQTPQPTRRRFVWPDWTGELVMATPVIGAGLTLVAVAQDKPRYIILGGGVFTGFAWLASEWRMSGDAPGPFALWYEECRIPGNAQTGPGVEVCEDEFNVASAVFYASAATLVWGLYRASEKGL